MKYVAYGFIALALSGCVSANLSDTAELEDFPLRAATKAEAAGLRKCLKTAWKEQLNHFQETGSFYKKFKDIPSKKLCSDFKVKLAVNENKFEILAQLNEGDNSVRWTIDDSGEMNEYTDPEDEIDETGF